MKTWFLTIRALFALMPLSAFAADGGEKAEKLCQDMIYANEVTACMKVVNGADYLEEGAVEVCGGLVYPAKITACFKAIQNKKYTDTAVKTCEGLLYPEKITKCFAESGRKKGGGDVDKDFVVSNLRQALKHLRNGDDDKAERIIESVITELK